MNRRALFLIAIFVSTPLLASDPLSILAAIAANQKPLPVSTFPKKNTLTLPSTDKIDKHDRVKTSNPSKP